MNYQFKKAVLRLVGIRLIECCENCHHFDRTGCKTCRDKDGPWTNAFINSDYRKVWHCCNWRPNE